MFELFKDLLKNVQSTNALATVDSVKTNVPANAQYITLVKVGISQDAVDLSKMNAKLTGASGTLNGIDAASISNAYMIHDGTDVLFISENQKVLLSTPISNIAELRTISSMKPSTTLAFKRGGFICILRDGRNIVVSTPVPVAKDNTTQFRTIGKITDITGGWADELKPYGVTVTY